MEVRRQVVILLAGEAFHFRGATIRNRTGKRVRLEVEMDAYEICKLRTGEKKDDAADNLLHNETRVS